VTWQLLRALLPPGCTQRCECSKPRERESPDDYPSEAGALWGHHNCVAGDPTRVAGRPLLILRRRHEGEVLRPSQEGIERSGECPPFGPIDQPGRALAFDSASSTSTQLAMAGRRSAAGPKHVSAMRLWRESGRGQDLDRQRLVVEPQWTHDWPAGSACGLHLNWFEVSSVPVVPNDPPFLPARAYPCSDGQIAARGAILDVAVREAQQKDRRCRDTDSLAPTPAIGYNPPAGLLSPPSRSVACSPRST
jgi:hypothetical protein